MKLSILPCTGYTISTKNLSEIKDLYLNGKLDTYDVWLQRLKQEDKWSKNDWEKSRSYLYRLFTSGPVTKSIFTVVDIDLLIERIEERIKFLSSESCESSIFFQMIKGLKNKKAKGCEFILLDGQNRLEYAIKRFFESELEWRYLDKLSQVPKELTFVKEGGTTYQKQSFTYKKLSTEEKNIVDDIKVIFAQGTQGEIDEFINDLIDDNSGEHWNDFEKKITNLKTLPYLVNTAVSSSEGNVPEFKQILDKVGSLTGDYHIEKKGYHKILCEFTQLDMNGTLKLDYEKMWDMTEHKNITKSFANVKEFFKAIAKGRFPLGKEAGNKNIFVTKEMLRNFYMIVKILNKGVGGYTVPLEKIKNMRAIYEDYMKFDNFKRDRIRNSIDFVNSMSDNTGVTVPKPGTYIWAMKSIEPDKLQSRKSILTTFVEEHIERWVDKQYFARLDRNELTDIQKRRVILEAQEDPFSVHGETLDPLVDNLHVDHSEQFGRGGSNDIGNLQATTGASNLARVK